MSVELPVLSMERAIEITGMQPEEWEWQCHAISMALAPEVGGIVRRGFFHGPTTSPVFQHSWIELPDGSVLDPTCHAFTDRPPLWHGPADEYDIGGCRHAAPAGPPPSFYESGSDSVDLNLPVSAAYVADLLRLDSSLWEAYDEAGWCLLSVEQVFWLANLPVKEREGQGVLGRFYAAEVYEAIHDAGYGAAIPIDRLAWILPERAPRGVRA